MLHLLRGCPPHFNGRPIDPEVFIRLLRRWGRKRLLFGSWTRRRPTRSAELRGGSVYFAAKAWTLFRVPLVRIEPVAEAVDGRAIEPGFENAWSLTCECDVTLVESVRVHRLQGWRYLTPEKTPRDIGKL